MIKNVFMQFQYLIFDMLFFSPVEQLQKLLIIISKFMIKVIYMLCTMISYDNVSLTLTISVIFPVGKARI